MKFASVMKLLVLGLAMATAASAFAVTKGNLALTTPATVNGTTLKAGDYKVQWDGTGPSVEVSVLQGKKVVAKVPAHVVDLQTAAVNDSAVLKKNEDGSSTLSGVRFHGKKFALELDSNNMGSPASE